jgi:hypothetical protein
MYLGGFWGVKQFSFLGFFFGHLVDGFSWFLGSQAIFLYGGLILGTV